MKVRFYLLFLGVNVILILFEYLRLLLNRLVLLLVFQVLLRQLIPLQLYIFLILGNVMVDGFVPSSHFLDFLLLLCVLLGVQISIAPNRLVEVLLLLQFGFCLNVLFLKLAN